MVINQTETRIPAGYTPKDLGEADSILEDKVWLVSFHTSPIVIGYEQTYILFILDTTIADNIDSVEWTALLTTDTQSIDVLTEKITDTNVTLTVNEPGILNIAAKIKFKDITDAVIKLSQKVKNTFFNIIPRADLNIPEFGNPLITTCIFDNYFKYLTTLRDSGDANNSAIRYFIFSFIYFNLIKAFQGLNRVSLKDNLNFYDDDFINGAGLAALRPYIMLYIIPVSRNSTSTLLYDSIIDYKPEDLLLEELAGLFKVEYNNFTDEEKIDNFNLLRFPKSHINICSEFIKFLQNKFYPGEDFNDCFTNQDKLYSLINQFFYGPFDNTISLSNEEQNQCEALVDRSNDLAKILAMMGLVKKILSFERYGNIPLKRDDRDSTLKYNGTVKNLADIEFIPNTNGHTASPRFINNLKNDLVTLGFNLFTNDAEKNNGEFDMHTEWAVREFQIYASMDKIAQFDAALPVIDNSIADKLRQVSNTMPYSGPKSGVFNQETKILMQHWLDNNYRCPVVISAFNIVASNRGTLDTDNLWRSNQITNSSPRIYVRDFSDYFLNREPTMNNLIQNNWIILGFYTKPVGYEGGPAMTLNHSWTNSEITFDNLTGITRNTADASQSSLVSTFKIIHVVSDAEVHKRYDLINCWDSGIVSIGIPHWTLRYNNHGNELGGTFYFIKTFINDVFNITLKFFGINDVDHTYNNSNKVFTGNIYRETETADIMADYTLNEISYYKNWHFVYRFVMMMRVFPSIRVFMWNIMRKRLSDVLNIEIGGGIKKKGTAINAKISDIFTSEKAIAIIFRWHVNSPGTLNASNRLRDVIKGNTPAEDLSSNYDTDNSQQLLVNRLINEVNTDSNTSIETFDTNVNSYQFEGVALSTNHNSFTFNSDSLPTFN